MPDTKQGSDPPEMTFRAVALGLFLALVFGAANAYLGMIAGEALMGIVLAVTFLSGISSFTHVLTGSDEFGIFQTWGGWLSYVGFAAVAWVLIRIPLGAKETQ